MNDRKLFYGKRKHTEEWVYGTLSVFEGGMSIWSEELKDDVEVMPSTVRLIEECSFDCEYGNLVKEIVRCKDCKYFHDEYCSMDDFHFDTTTENDFCSFGVRRDENEVI